MSHYDSTLPYPRDLKGYGPKPPHAQWPNQARIAVQFVLNYEEGGENCVLHGDAGSEQFLSEMASPASYPARHISMEGIYEYGSRAGVWRILREFEQRGLPLTVFGVSMALQRYPELVQACQQLGHEIACHGWRWIHYQNLPEEVEREHLARGMEILTKLMGERPLGWYTGRDSPKTDCSAVPQLIVPYTLDCNDMRFALPQGYSHADPFFQYLKDTFDALYAEGDPAGLNAPKMMSVGMHCRLLGRPGRITALQRFLDHIAQFEGVWVARRIDIARHWRKVHPHAQAELA